MKKKREETILQLYRRLERVAFKRIQARRKSVPKDGRHKLRFISRLVRRELTDDILDGAPMPTAASITAYVDALLDAL